MIPVPDFSYFALQGFLQNKSRHAGSSSLFLFHEEHLEWDDLLDNTPSLMNYIHEQSGKHHDIYIPYAPNDAFTYRFESHFRKFLAPAEAHIRTLLIDCGVEDVEEFMEDSIEWLGLLYAHMEQQYRACRLLAEKIHVDSTSDFPMMLVWTNPKEKEAMVIPLAIENPKLDSYFKTMVWAVTSSTKRLLKHGNLTVDNLLIETNHSFRTSMFFRNKQEFIPELKRILLPVSMEEILSDIGQLYSREFEDAIINFARYVKEKDIRILNRYCEERRRDIEKMLEEHGFYRKRHGANHDIWKHPKLNKNTPVPRHNKISPLVVDSIRRDVMLATQA